MPLDLEGLAIEKKQLEQRLAAINKILEGAEELNELQGLVGSDYPRPARPPGTGRTNPPKKRERRRKAETDRIRERVVEEVLDRPGTKREIFDRLVSTGDVVEKRRDSEFVLRVLKEETLSGTLAVEDDVYTTPRAESSQEIESPATGAGLIDMEGRR